VRISHSNKFIFFSMPKTGSESVRTFLDPYSDVEIKVYKDIKNGDLPFYSHMRPIDVRKAFTQLNWDYDSYYKFMVVRNPWARLVSLYEMIYRHPLKKYYRPKFSRWIKSIDQSGVGAGGKVHQKWRRYGAYSVENFIGDDIESLVNEFVKLEELNLKVPTILNNLNILDVGTEGVPHVNKGRRNSEYHSYYDKGARDFVAEKYACEIDMFDYKF
jgi:hypothetical protein